MLLYLWRWVRAALSDVHHVLSAGSLLSWGFCGPDNGPLAVLSDRCVSFSTRVRTCARKRGPAGGPRKSRLWLCCDGHLVPRRGHYGAPQHTNTAQKVAICARSATRDWQSTLSAELPLTLGFPEMFRRPLFPPPTRQPPLKHAQAAALFLSAACHTQGDVAPVTSP